MMYTFTCNKCLESFNVQSKYLVQKERLICPNCSNQLPDNVFEKLKSAAQALNEYDKNSEILNNNITLSNKNHFYYKIQ